MARGHSLRPRTPGVGDVLGTGCCVPASLFWREAFILKNPPLLTPLLCCQYRYSHVHEQVNEILVLKTGISVTKET